MLVAVSEIEINGMRQAFAIDYSQLHYHKLTQRWRTTVRNWRATVLPQISTRRLEAHGPKGLILRFSLLEPEEFEALSTPVLEYKGKSYDYLDYQHWIFKELTD